MKSADAEWWKTADWQTGRINGRGTDSCRRKNRQCWKNTMPTNDERAAFSALRLQTAYDAAYWRDDLEKERKVANQSEPLQDHPFQRAARQSHSKPAITIDRYRLEILGIAFGITGLAENKKGIRWFLKARVWKLPENVSCIKMKNFSTSKCWGFRFVQKECYSLSLSLSFSLSLSVASINMSSSWG